jgi:hypothetical protein
MSDTSPPSGYVLRRVPAVRLSGGVVHRDAFGPTAQDTTGVSVYREELYRNQPEAILVDVPEAKRGTYFVVRVSVDGLTALGLTIADEPAALPGHAVIPELARPTREANRAWANEVQAKLAAIAEVVYSPPLPPPTSG